MVYYNVVRPCVVGKLHYASIPSQPILVDDEVAAPLVEAGALTVYAPGQFVEAIAPGTFAKALATGKIPLTRENYAKAYGDDGSAVREALALGDVDPGTFTLARPDVEQPVRGPARKRAPRKASED